MQFLPNATRLSPLCSYRRTYKPASYHIIQELQKYNIPDYRPRQEQYVPEIVVDCRHRELIVGVLAGFKRR
jgi:hypothetical protein